jgi:PadR family transcriptional regulator PadR
MGTVLFDNLRMELRRGCLTLAVLAQLRQERYGYTLRKTLIENGLPIDESTLYPLLRRLENQGLLVSQWREENKRKKRFYRLSPEGEHLLQRLLAEWQAINAALNGFDGLNTPAGNTPHPASGRGGLSQEPRDATGCQVSECREAIPAGIGPRGHRRGAG